MEFNFWKQISVLDVFLITLNGVLLLLLFTASTTKAPYEPRYFTSTPAQAEPSPSSEPAWAADDSAFIAAMMAP